MPVTPALEPWFEDSSEQIPLPNEENFMLTPNGLALIYIQGEISSESEGVVILCVDYKDIKDILKTEVVTY